MKKLLTLTSLLLAMHVGAAVSFYDPFADATASGGTSYTPNSYLAGGPTTIPTQTNAQGFAWFCVSNTFPVNAGVPVITNDNLSYPGIGSSSGNAVYIPPQPGNMGRITLPATVSTGQCYYSFMLKVTDISTLTSATSSNFLAGFTDTIGNTKQFLIRAQSYLVAKQSGGGYVLGIGKNKPAVANVTYDTTVRNVGDTLFIVAGYDFVTSGHPANLWINPTGTNLGAATPPAATVSDTTGTELASAIAGFVLGGYTNAAPPACVVDDVRVSTNWAVVTGAPEIQAQPATTQSKNAGDAVTIKATVTGASPTTYQWQRNGVNVTDGGTVSGATTAILSVSSASQASAGTYTLLITNGLGTATSSSSVLNVTDPYITTQPVSQTVSPGTDVNFSVTALGAASLSYQWFKGASALVNGGNISGAASSTLTITGTSGSDVGSYSCYVTNGLGGTAQTSTATLSATDPAITAQPQSVTGNYGTTATFSVSVIGSSPITYQWHHGVNNLSNGSNISGAQSATLTVSSMSYTDDGSYTVTVTSPGGSIDSSAATLTAIEPIITGQPASATVASAGTATFSVTVTGAAPITYQWKKNGSNLTDGGNVVGALTSALTLTGVSSTDATSYTVLVGDASGTNVLSSNAILTVLSPPSITSQPSSRTIVAGHKAAFAVSATGAAPLSYQWLLNGSPISGATTFVYTIASAQASDNGSYSVVVTNSINSVTSSAAVLSAVPSVRLYTTNLIVLRAGDGAETQTLNGNSVFLDQYDPTGNYVNTVSIPSSGSSALIEMGLDQNSSTLTGSALSRSANSRYIVLPGYNTAAPYSGALQSSTSAAVPRGIGLVDTYGNFTLAIADTNAYNATYFRAAAFDGTNDFWGAGNAGGTYYFGLDAAAATIQTSFANLRSVDIFNGNLYTVSGSGSGTGILKWNGRPTTATAATTLFVPASVPSDIAVDSTGTNIYVGTSAGVAKWQFDGSTWTLVYTLGTGSVRYVAVDFSGAAPVIFATTTDSSFNRIVTVTDTGVAAPVTTFTTAGVNQTFRGLRFGPTETPVAVTSSPTSQTGATGGSVTFTGSAAGDTPLTYQWFKDSVALADGTTGSGSIVSGAFNATLSIANLSAADQGSYSFTVTNMHSSATSSSASLTVINPVSISSGPTSQTANFGDNVVLSVSAVGGGTLSYQWQKGGVNLSNTGNITGSTTSSLTVSSVASTDAQTYSVVVSNGASSNSASATLTVNDPAITVQPTPATVQCGGNAIFNVSASGTPSVTYQWYENGNPLSDGVSVSGSTSTSLTLVGVTTAGSGNSYSVAVAGLQTVTSTAAALTVVDTAPPVVTLNGSATMNVDCNSSFSDPGATASDSCAGSLSVSTTGTVNGNVAGTYTLTYSAIDPSNNTGSATRVVTVTGCGPSIDTQPQSHNINAGTDLTLSVVAGGSSPTYQWYKGTSAIAAATDATFVKTNAVRADADSYYVTVTANSVTATSAVAVITVTDPAINMQPANAIGSTGSNVVLTIGAGGTALKYQWFQHIGSATKTLKDSGAAGILGATTSTLTLSKLTAGKNAGNYYCVVTNAPNGHLTSDSVTVTLYDPPKLVIVSKHGPHVKQGFDNTLTAKISKGLAPFTYQWFQNGNAISGATDSTYFIGNVQPGYEGLYSCDVHNNAPNKGTASLLISLLLDTKAPPMIMIKDPKDKTKATNGLVVATQTNVAPEVDIRGKALDNGLLVSVTLIRTNPSTALLTVPATFVMSDLFTPTNPVAGKISLWATHVQLADGTNTFYAAAVDSASNTNYSKAVNYYYIANPDTFHVVVEKQGGGTARGSAVGVLSNLGKPVNGTLLDVGQPYVIKAAPTTTFLKWTDGTQDLSTSSVLTFIMTNGLTLHAVFSR